MCVPTLAGTHQSLPGHCRGGLIKSVKFAKDGSMLLRVSQIRRKTRGRGAQGEAGGASRDECALVECACLLLSSRAPVRRALACLACLQTFRASVRRPPTNRYRLQNHASNLPHPESKGSREVAREGRQASANRRKGGALSKLNIFTAEWRQRQHPWPRQTLITRPGIAARLR